MSRPTILVDQDGPLADFDAHFWSQAQGWGVKFNCEPHEQTARFATDHIPDPAERRLARLLVNGNPYWFEVLPVVAGAVAGINLLAEVADVWICTKPLEANPHCRDAKAKWVRKHLGKDWEQRLIIAPDKSMVRGDILLDDAPKSEWFGRAAWKPVIFPAPFNREGSEWAGLPSWDWSRPVEDLLAILEYARGGALV